MKYLVAGCGALLASFLCGLKKGFDPICSLSGKGEDILTTLRAHVTA